MDRYFYEVSTSGNNKEIHVLGNIYLNDADNTDTNYRIDEPVGFSMSLDEFKCLFYAGELFDYISQHIEYSKDVTKETAIITCKMFYEGFWSGKELDIDELSSETPDGQYWYERL